MSKVGKILVIIPAYNEEASIGRVIEDVRKHLPGADVLVVNDGSLDSTSSEARNKGALVLDLPYNLGIGGAVQTGCLYAFQQGYEFVLRLDGDGQHHPQEGSKILSPLLKGEADIVIGSRFLSKEGYKSTFLRRMGIRFFSFVIWLITRGSIKDPTSGFNGLNRKGIELISSKYSTDYPEVEALIVARKRGLRVKEVPVIMKKRGKGKSSIDYLEAVYYMIKVSISTLIGRIKKV
ncbi:MAG: glycosyltransferase family 2 protein [Deltaproteobacteria bacterium]|nr:glycosyltransferase family 2 protein [Deltaproteobacteria bacterium]